MKIIKREKSTSTKGHYVTNAVLLPAVIEAKELGRVTDKLISMIMKIAERYSHKHNFVGYSFREDMVSAAVMNLCNNALKFNPEKSSNPFSFYTTAIHNSFLQYMADEKKHRNIRDALLMDAGANPSYNFLEKEKDESSFEIKDSDNFNYEPVSRFGEVEDAAPAQTSDDQHLTRARSSASLRAKSREPGPVIRYKPEDVEVDPVTGRITIKEKPGPVIEAPVKKARAPRKTVTKKLEPEAVVQEKLPRNKKVAEEASTDKKSAPRKGKSVGIPEAKLTPLARTKKAAEEKAPAKKTAAKKTPAEKAPAKKTAAKKTTTKAK